MQSRYDPTLTQRLRDLISKCYIKREELDLHEIQDLLLNPLVDPNPPKYYGCLSLPQYTLHNLYFYMRWWGSERGLRETLMLLDLFSRRQDFDANHIGHESGTALIHDAVGNRDTYDHRVLRAVLKFHKIDVNLTTKLAYRRWVRQTALEIAVDMNSIEKRS